jgi:hypothetical protein
LPLQSIPRLPWSRLPGSFPPALSTTVLMEKGRAALQGITARTGRATPHSAVLLS